MKIYLVGGAVRDKLLGLTPKEKDYVVVGATVKDMLNLGYQQVGKEFPVFLHPKTREEYALARMERKVGLGYKGFTFDASSEVTLEEDLIRRDLTINAMAEEEDGKLIDPYHGKNDLDKKLLRHVSPAFAEDPVRILRVGRFLARYAYMGFTVAPETIQLMKKMVEAGEVNALVPERVWKELERALGEQHPEKFFEVLDQCGALSILFPELSMQSAGMHGLQIAAQNNLETVVRFAVLLHDLPDAKKTITELCNRYRVPNQYKELALITALHYKTALSAHTLSAEELLTFFNSLDIYRRMDRFEIFLEVCAVIAFLQEKKFDRLWLFNMAEHLKNHSAMTAKALVEQGVTGMELGKELNRSRLEIIQQLAGITK